MFIRTLRTFYCFIGTDGPRVVKIIQTTLFFPQFRHYHVYKFVDVIVLFAKAVYNCSLLKVCTVYRMVKQVEKFHLNYRIQLIFFVIFYRNVFSISALPYHKYRYYSQIKHHLILSQLFPLGSSILFW